MKLARLLLLVCTCLSTGLAAGHHSPAAFDLAALTNVRGSVTRFDWKNPHVYLFIEGADDSGRSGEWQIEADPTPLMSRSGWTASTLTPGEVVSVQINPDRNSQERHGLLVSLTKTNGVTLRLRTGASTTMSPAHDISGTWDALGHFAVSVMDQVYEPERGYTEAALAAQAEYSDELYPPSACLPFATPLLTLLPYLNEIEILEDRVLIRSEFYSVERTIYMDGRSHPRDGDRTIQGHSVGHWEGDALVVDTRLFADYRLANGPGVPSGPQKHTIERFELSADRTELRIDIVVEDPEFVVEPFTVSTIWDYAPGRRMESFECNPENARFFFSR